MANYRIIYNVVIYSLVGQKTLDNTYWMSQYLSEVLRLGKGGGRFSGQVVISAQAPSQ